MRWGTLLGQAVSDARHLRGRWCSETAGQAAASLCETRGDAGQFHAQVLCGLLLSIVFVQSHNGMEVYSGAKDFVTAQARALGTTSSFASGNLEIEEHWACCPYSVRVFDTGLMHAC